MTREEKFRRFAIIFALICILLTLGVRTARAAPFTPALNLAYNLAISHWGEPEGCLDVERAIVPDELMPTHEGEATMPEPGERLHCHVWIRRSLAPLRMFGRACAVMFHEVGHLNGFDHNANPHSIMNPTIFFVPSECWRRITYMMNHPHYNRTGGEQ